MHADKLDGILPEELDARRKKILFRSAHRGIKEMDIMIGGFASARIATLNDDELDELEALMEIPDQDLLAWMTGRKPAPERWNTGLYRAILAFQRDSFKS